MGVESNWILLSAVKTLSKCGNVLCTMLCMTVLIFNKSTINEHRVVQRRNQHDVTSFQSIFYSFNLHLLDNKVKTNEILNSGDEMNTRPRASLKT